jgi:Ca2+-transporting ATPase
MLLWHESPLLSMQLLWINLVTDSLPAIALGMEPVEKDIMDHAPRPKTEGLFAHGYGVRIALQGVMFGTLSLIAYWLGKSMMGSVEAGQTMAFMVLAMSQIVQAYNMRSEHSLFKLGIFSNKQLNKAALASVALTALVVFIPPVANIFNLIMLPWHMYLIALGLILAPFVVMEISKALGLIKHRSHHSK